MGYVLVIFRFLLFLLSSLGFWEYFRRKSKMNVYFLPAFTISLQSTVLFCAGILNCLKLAVFLMFAAGIVLVVYYLYTDFKETIYTYKNCGYVFLAISFCLVLIACIGQKFTEYDNFSHWALAVKNIVLTDRYPSFAEPVIGFQEYPLGSISYIYFFVKIVSDAESVQMAAQGLMMLCFILPVFKYIEKYKIISCMYVLLFVNYIFCYNILIANLLVDTLLPLQGMAALFFIFSECLNLDTCKIPGGGVSILYAIPFLCMSVQIKNSGIYFAVLACILIGFSFKNHKEGKTQKILTMVVPFLSLYLWHAHCSYVFSEGSMSKHAMTIQNYKSVFSQKTGEDINIILNSVWKFSIGGKEAYYILFFAFIIGMLTFLTNVSIRKKYAKLMLTCVIMYIIYMVGMACMYLFSMPINEAKNLSGIARYRNTIFIAIYYAFLLFALMILSSIEKIRKERIFLAGIFIALIVVWGTERSKPFPTIFIRVADERREQVEQVIEDNGVPFGSSCIVCGPTERDAEYMYYLCKYLLMTNKISPRAISEKNQLDDAQNYEYILIYDEENEVIRDWVKENYPEQEGRSAILITNHYE